MNRQKFLKSLSNLSGWREAVFILSLAERSLPNLQLYLEQLEDAGAAKFIDKCMDSSWDALLKQHQEVILAELLDQVLAPRDALLDDDNYGALPSLDCLWLWEQALVSQLNSDVKRASEASQRSLATITQFLEFSEGEGLSEDSLVSLFDSHDLVKREFSFQQELSEILRLADRFDDRLVKRLRELAHDEGVSNIGISIL